METPTQEIVRNLIGQYVRVIAPGGTMFVEGTLHEAQVDPRMFAVYTDRHVAGVCFTLHHVRRITKNDRHTEIQLKRRED